MVFLWIVFGCILGGAVHDYCIGMISVRMGGASISEIVGKYLGNGARQVMRFFAVGLLILLGAVFITSPAALIAMLTPESFGTSFWTVVILLYYLLATLLPIDKFIGKLYPIFGIALIIMVLGIGGGIVFQGYHIPDLTLVNLHPDGKLVWPFMFITVACGAISGFHATQSPMMARCLKTEKDGQRVFYGAMIMEGVIALIWAVAVYLRENCGKNQSLIAALPAVFMSGVCSTYILMADEGLRLSVDVAYPLGMVFAAICGVIFLIRVYWKDQDKVVPM